MALNSVESSRDLSLAEVTAPRPAEAIAYWRSKIPRGAPYPARAHLDPLEVPKLLGYLVLTEVFHEPELSFRFRLFGTAVAELLQVDATSQWLSSESLGQIAPYARDRLSLCATQGRPLAAENTLHKQGRAYVRYQVADLPLGTPDTGVTMILSCLERL